MTTTSAALALNLLEQTFAKKEEFEKFQKDDLEIRKSLAKTLKQINHKLSTFITKTDLEKQLTSQKSSILDEVHLKLTNLSREIDQKLDEKLSNQEKVLLQDFAEYFETQVMPVLNTHEKQLNHLNKHTSHPPIPSL